MNVVAGERAARSPLNTRRSSGRQHHLGSLSAGIQQPLVRLLFLVRRPVPERTRSRRPRRTRRTRPPARRCAGHADAHLQRRCRAASRRGKSSFNFGAATFLRTDAEGNPGVDTTFGSSWPGCRARSRAPSCACSRPTTPSTIRRDADLEPWTSSITWTSKPAATGGAVSDAHGRDQVLGGVGRHPAGNRPRAGQPPVAPGRQRRRELPRASR